MQREDVLRTPSDTEGANMRTRSLLLLIAAAAMLGSGAAAQAASKEAQRTEVRRVSNQTLQRLYQLQPRAKDAIQRSAGYATFSNFGMKLLVAGGGRGEGVAVNNMTKQETFMKMVEVQAGLGFGIKKFRLVWVFETQGAFDNFVNSGWELGGQATAAAQMSGQGAWAAGAMSVSPGIWLYQLTDNGLALELTAKGTKYYKDDKLN
jgi:lipid-binding SYLF domain-containing protein